MVALDISSLTFETHTTGLSLLNSAKCYRTTGSTSKQGLVLLIAHGTGYHKEHWEPTIEQLFVLDSQHPSRTPHIRECWAIDAQNHGEAALLNEQVIRERPETWSSWDYADAFVTLRRDILGADPSYRETKFVLVAHSASTTAAILTTTFFPLPVLQTQNIFHSLILIEPAIVPGPAFLDFSRHTPLLQTMTRLMAKRKDTWASKEEARAWLAEKMPWGMWDARVLDRYVEYGLGQQSEGAVTLRCARRTESLAYERGLRQSLPALWQLNLLCTANAHIGESDQMALELTSKASKPGGSHRPVIPIHVLWGDIDDLFSREMKDGLEDPEQGRVFTSVRRVEDVGHMMVQTSPEATAKAIWDILWDSVKDVRLDSREDGSQMRSRL
ncbi:Alpha/Beta hydrolase protein [Lentinula raphanica]|nr:Alpha/Beta hydrolase protein [Lentinula raphanica]